MLGAAGWWQGCVDAVAARPYIRNMEFRIECEREEDGRWLAEVPQLPGALAYGSSQDEAMARVEILALRVLAEQLENGETKPQPIRIAIAAA